MGFLTLMPSSTSVESFFNLFMVLIIALVFAPFIGIFVTIKKKRERYNNGTSKIDWKLKLPFLLKPIIGIVVAILILIINPVSDIIYYLGAIFCMCMSAWMFVDIINRYNILSTRKLPQLNKRGGDEVE